MNPFDFFVLLCSFIYGNIFTIQYSTLDWGFLVIFCVVFFIETIDRFLYLFFNPNQQNKLRTENQNDVFENMNIGFKFSELRTEFRSNNGGIKKRILTKLGLFDKRSALTELKKRSKISTFFLLNTLKRGFLLGFFLEAFKVGS